MKLVLKDPELLRHWLHPKLFDILSWLLTWWPADFVVTSLWRKKGPGESGIHETDPLRAIDVRSNIFPPVVCKMICDEINKVWEYDPTRPTIQVCYWHDAGRGRHFHIQVHPNTRKRSHA